MSKLSRILVLNTLIKHETLTLADLGKEENIGIAANQRHLLVLVEDLEDEGLVEKINGATISTYSVTDKGIDEGKRLEAL